MLGASTTGSSGCDQMASNKLVVYAVLGTIQIISPDVEQSILTVVAYVMTITKYRDKPSLIRDQRLEEGRVLCTVVVVSGIWLYKCTSCGEVFSTDRCL